MDLNKTELNTLSSTSVCERKAFLALFVPVLGDQYRHALRYVYRHAVFVQLAVGEKALSERLMGEGDNMIILLKGLVSGYLNSGLGKRYDTWLGESNSVFIYNRSGDGSQAVNLEAIDHSLLIVISRKELESGCEAFPVLNRLFTHLIFPNAIRDLNHYSILSKLDSPSSRFSYFQRMYPGVWHRVPARIYQTYASNHFL
ncbi:hypothetical protein [Pedobacter sp. N23S346]|uniref:hypothetical protein n=1 Tax=Pedobacter sp. N23S346 TaxID=3402750 RepID=UPI003AC96531